jgi:hypothetical protein
LFLGFIGRSVAKIADRLAYAGATWVLPRHEGGKFFGTAIMTAAITITTNYFQFLTEPRP